MHPRLQQDLTQFPQILDHTRQLAEDFWPGCSSDRSAHRSRNSSCNPVTIGWRKTVKAPGGAG